MTATTDNPTTYAECDACGGEFIVRPSGRSFAGPHKDNGDRCLGRPKTETAITAPGKRVKEKTETLDRADCNACGRKGIAVKAGKLFIHKDFKANARCVGSMKDPSEVPAAPQQPPARPKAAKPKPAPKPPAPVLSPLSKAMAKAARFGEDLKKHDWRTTFEQNPDDKHPLTGEPTPSVTAVAKRGSRTDVETMRITWWGGACIGGDGRITWSYKGHTIAVRNANACRLLAERAHEDLVEAAVKRINSKAVAQKKRGGKGEKMERSLPFDPETVTDEELVDRLIGRAVTWHNAVADKQETYSLRPKVKPTVKKLNNGERVVNVLTIGHGTRSFRLSGLINIK